MTVTPAGGSAITVVTNTYDVYNLNVCSRGSGLVLRAGQRLHDDANFGTGFLYRGNLTYSTFWSGHKCVGYETTGVVTGVESDAGYVELAADIGTGYSLPVVIKPEGSTTLATTVTYATSWGVTSVTGPNGAGGNTTYDLYGRPQSTQIPDGATTAYAYSYYDPGDSSKKNIQTATIGSGSTARWKKTTLDGFGRPVKTEAGYGTTTVSVVETEYAACACSPMGKLYRVSQPHGPNASAIWTTYYYDGAGRTVKVVAPDNSGSTTEYLTTYGGTTGSYVRSTDPAGKWKIQKSDAAGNLGTVIEPNPAGGSDLTTDYTYNVFGQMAGVSMTRGRTTQTRTFAYTAADMTSATNPENGTVAYEYDKHRVTKRTDAKGQETRYSYDGYGRMTQVQHWAWAPGANNTLVLTEQTDQGYTYYYDVNPCDPSFSQSAWGRLTAVNFSLNGYGDGCRYQYSYNTAGRVTKQKMAWTMHAYDEPDHQYSMTANYEWDNEGRQTSLTYPVVDDESVGTKETYQFDSMGRLSGMVELPAGSITPYTIASATYGVAGEMLGLNYFGMNESRSYNSMFQLTHQSVTSTMIGTLMDMTYNFTNGANNGRIVSATDGVVGETVNYSYDSLNRLSLAETAGSGGWGQAFTYDGFGNMTAKTATKGTGVPAFSTTINPATNGGPTSYAHAVPDGMDVENRPFGGPNGGYTYDQAGKRVLTHDSGPYAWSGSWEFVMYDVGGRRLKTVTCSYSSVPVGDGVYHQASSCGGGSRNVYFGGKLVVSHDTVVAVDRLGSVRANGNGERFAYYPYGEERGTSNDGREKFGTYVRDSATQDYADQRYYGVGTGRFNVPDPYTNSAGPRDPGSWNRYVYVGGDPINFIDPGGNQRVCIGPSDDRTCWDVPDDPNSTGERDLTGGAPPIEVGEGGTTNTDQGGGGAWGFLGYNQKGMDVAKGALKGILNLKFDSGPCQADFAALSKAADKTIDANAIDAWANEILNSGTLYDGDTSNTTWSVANFGGTQKYGSSPPPSWTVGAEFVTNNVLALSQATGSAIWVKSGAWQSFAADYAQGTLIHEIIHKFGVNDGQMAGALVVSLAAGSEVMSRKLRDDCVRQ